jgi:hypothetical protein
LRAVFEKIIDVMLPKIRRWLEISLKPLKMGMFLKN